VESGQRLRTPAWINGQADKEAKSDQLGSKERKGQLAAVAGFVILVVFVALHQTESTGLFTDEFGTAAAVLLYGMIVFGTVPLLVRFLVVRKNNPARLLEAAAMALSFVGHLYFFVVFPFDMSHFADPLPGSLEFLIDWISPTLAKWILGLGAIGSVIFTVYDLVLYMAVEERLSITDKSRDNQVRE